MTTDDQRPRKNAPTTRGKPFQPGNPGRPRGSRHKASLAVEALLEGEAEGLARKAVELALAGDVTALRLCMDRIAPPRKDRHVNIALPAVETTGDLMAASAALLAAVASGEVTPSEAAELGKLVQAHAQTMQAVELEQRIARLEGARR